MVKASEIQQGQFFRKRRGTYVYLRVSESSVRFLKLPEDKIYGVCFNGNVAVVDPDTFVERCVVGDFVKNIEDQDAWHQMVGARVEPIADINEIGDEP